MTDQPQDAPRLPSRSREDFSGSLAEHVRNFATEDPQEAALRDQLAGAAEGYAQHQDVAQQLSEEPQKPSPAADGVVWDVPPPGTDKVLDKNMQENHHSGGLWTNQVTGQQFGHGYFANAMGPFRPVPDSAS